MKLSMTEMDRALVIQAIQRESSQNGADAIPVTEKMIEDYSKRKLQEYKGDSK